MPDQKTHHSRGGYAVLLPWGILEGRHGLSQELSPGCLYPQLRFSFPVVPGNLLWFGFGEAPSVQAPQGLFGVTDVQVRQFGNPARFGAGCVRSEDG